MDLRRLDPVKAAASETSGRVVGLREAGKAERLRRLKEATRTLLLERGYDQVTTREISLLAGVSIGTLFVYAKDKRDLLYLVVNDELDPVAAYAHAHVPAEGRALDKVCAFVTPWYEYFAANLAIGRWAFRELGYYHHHPEDCDDSAVRLRARMRAQEARVCQIVEDARERGQLVFPEPASLVGSTLYDIYQEEIRTWLYGGEAIAALGVARVRSKFALLLDRMERDAGR